MDNERHLELRVTELLEVIEDIALIADGHRGSTACDESRNNIALSVILARTAAVIGKAERLRDTGTILAPPGTVVR